MLSETLRSTYSGGLHTALFELLESRGSSLWSLNEFEVALRAIRILVLDSHLCNSMQPMSLYEKSIEEYL